MGRPINSKFFGNLNRPYNNFATGGLTGVGGESIATVSVSNSGTLYSQGAVVTISAPNITGGIRATVSTTANAAGNVAVTIANSGTGYTATSTLSISTASAVTKVTTGTSATTVIYPATTSGIYVGMKVIGTGISASATYVTSFTGAAVNLTWPNATAISTSVNFVDVGTGFAGIVSALTTTTQNALRITTYLTTGSSAVTGGDILKQDSSRKYLVQNSQGRGVVKLSAGTGTNHVLEPGGMHLIATDFGGSTYYVLKLTARRVTLTDRSGTSTALVTLTTGTDGVKTGSAKWTLGAATGTIVTLSNA